MRKDLSNVLACYGDFDFNLHEEAPSLEFSVDNSVERQIVSAIYSPTEDGRMESDIAQFLSDKVRPELKEFIQNNLFKLQSPIRSELPFDVISDEEQAALVPSSFETFDSYSERVRNYIDSLQNKEGE